MPPSTSTKPKARSKKYEKFLAEKTRKCDELASGYTPAKRRLEKIMISIFAGLFFFSLSQVFSVAYLSDDSLVNIESSLLGLQAVTRATTFMTVTVAFAMGMLTADFFSGVVHWFADTFCTRHTPVLGNLIRSFREHHVDQQAITRHDVIQSNGDNCMVSNILFLVGRVLCFNLWWKLPFLPGTSLSVANLVTGQDAPLHVSLESLFVLTWVTSLALMFALTNQIHKWAHQYSVPFWVKWLQDSRIILHRKDHMIHHTNPFDRYYCITTGWLNPVLRTLHFWRAMEFIVTTLSGGTMLPRVDDMKWTSHMAILEEESDIEDDSFYKSSRKPGHLHTKQE